MKSLSMAAALASLAMAGCTHYSSFGFPIDEGSIDAGRQAFVDHQCHACHTVAGTQLPDLAGASPPLLELGGETSQIMSYSGLVTSIINPDHRISPEFEERQRRLFANSPMPMRHIDTMTVRQLIDIVTFLDSTYILIDDYESAADGFFPAAL